MSIFVALGLVLASTMASFGGVAAAQPGLSTGASNLTAVTGAESIAELINADDYRVGVDPEILRLYRAFFDREPDIEGVKYWIGVSQGSLDAKSYSTLEIARFFVDASPEFARTYASAPDNKTFLTLVYENVLGRVPDAAGFNYWLDILNGTNETGGNPALKIGDRGEVIYYVAVNQEFINAAPYLPGTGDSVIVKGIFTSDIDAGAIQAALDEFNASSDLHAKYIGDPALEGKLQSGDPDASIAIHSAGRSRRHMEVNESFIPLPPAIVAAKLAGWPSPWRDMGDANSVRNTVPFWTIPKSLVWHRPNQFAARGYNVPTSLDELRVLEQTMIANDEVPYCVGIESGPSTGWVYTDEVEEDLLRTSGPDVYDQWIDHTIPFTDPAVTAAMQRVIDLWNVPGMVYASSGSIASTPYQQAIRDFEDGDCMMIRQASFAPLLMSGSTPLADGSPESIDVFYHPTTQENHRPTSGSLQVLGALDDRQEVWTVFEYMMSTDFAERSRRAAGSAFVYFYSLAQGQDISVYPPIEQRMIRVAEVTTVIRLDASDQFPAVVGAGTFWSEGTAAVNGDTTVAQAAAAIETSWPK